jgi:GT2 family glycosyltransferase
MASEFDVPVVLMTFNRPEHARAVFDRIAAIRPKRFFIIADGPRPNRRDDVSKCREARAVVDLVNSPCDLHTNFSDMNLGYARRISSGLDWVFDRVDRAILLEDDCVPDPSFFAFCGELLERYEDDHRVRTISGTNFLFGKARTDWSYHFSSYRSIWGWELAPGRHGDAPLAADPGRSLHGYIMARLLDREAVLLENSYGKNSRIWTSGMMGKAGVHQAHERIHSMTLV